MRNWLPQLSWDRPVTVLMGFLALLVLGLIAWGRIPVQMMPSGFEPRFMWVWVPFRNATPTETDDLLVRPIEEQLATVSGIKRIRSNARDNGASFQLEFHASASMDQLYGDVVDRLERSMPDLPEEVDRYWVYKYNQADDPIIWAGVSFPEDVDDAYHVMTKVVQPRLERIPGVASLDVWGVDTRRIYVDYDRERLLTHAVDVGSVQRSLATDNFQMTGGRVEDEGVVRHVRSLARIEDLDTLRRWPIDGNGRVLEDIADISFRGVRTADINRIAGEEAAALGISRESGANTVAVCEEVQRVLKELEQDPRVHGARFFVFFSQGELITESNDNLADTALYGGFLSVIILWLFLREWRMTLLIAASIPFSLLITVGVLYFRGDTLNLIAMMGLMLAVGMVVDNAIVVVESIYRRRNEGAEPRAAAIEGTAEVNLAIIMSTATSMVVFLPVILMSEDATTGFFMSVMGLPVVFSLGGSLIVALIFAPLATRFVGHTEVRPDPAWLAWLTRRYVDSMRWILAHRVDATIALLAMFMLTFVVAIPGVKCTGDADGNLNDFTIRFSVPRDAPPSRRDEIVHTFETLVADHAEEWGVRVYRARLGDRSTRGELYVYLETDGPMPREEVMEAARKLLPTEIPGVEGAIGWQDDGGGGNDSSLELAIYGEDMEVLYGLADEVARRMKGVEGVIDAAPTVLDDGADELRLRLDRDALRRYGLSAMSVGQTVGFAMRGSQLEPIRVGGQEVEVVTQLELEDRSDLDTLLDFPVWAPRAGTLLPVRALTNVEVAKGPARIQRENRRTSVSVRVDLAEDVVMQDLRPRIDEAMADFVMPRGYSWSSGSRFRDMEMEDDALALAMLLSVTFVFLLMGILFESFVLPLSILTTVPMAMAGAFWGLYLTGTPMDTMAGVGLIILVGVVVNNGIVLVDMVTQLRAEGVDRDEALVLSGERRLRPILMTASTTICGLIPMAMGSSAFIGIPYAPLGRTVIGGLTASTLLTLVFVPYLYTVLDDLRDGSRHWAAFAFRDRRKEARS